VTRDPSLPRGQSSFVLLHIHRDRIGLMLVHLEHNVSYPAAAQVESKRDVDLIQARELRLRTSVECRNAYAVHHDQDIVERTTVPDSRSVKRQVNGRIESDVNRDRLARRGAAIEQRDGKLLGRIAGINSDGRGSGDSRTVAADAEQSRGNLSHSADCG